ncbi:hypothetical protein M1P97_16585 [Parabacteroides sp. GYB001]|uniref:hypothetical protein n=1 Tax=Parabacteroides leei TaxID=2939491 RepID=UPI0020182F04|nr:hypothetical protein [Parabacteroides leei]MCL3852904.1 hypothetical protein [Parabacteroides leei]
MTNNTQFRTQRISFVLALSVITYTAIDTYLFAYHDIDIMEIMTPVILGLVATILLCGLLQRSFYKWITKYSINLSFARQSPIVLESGTEIKAGYTNEIQAIEEPSALDNYDAILENVKKKEAERQVKIMDAIREYVTIKTAPYLSQEAIATLIANIEYMACDHPDLYKPIRSNIDNPLRSPGLRHLAWNIGERLNVPLVKRAEFIKASFPQELVNATTEYLRLNLRDTVTSQIPIDVPDKGDFRFHLDTDNDDSQ